MNDTKMIRAEYEAPNFELRLFDGADVICGSDNDFPHPQSLEELEAMGIEVG